MRNSSFADLVFQARHRGLAGQGTFLKGAPGGGAKDRGVAQVATVVSVESSADDLKNALAEQFAHGVSWAAARIVNTIGKGIDQRMPSAPGGSGDRSDSGVAVELGFVEAHEPIPVKK